MLQRQCGPSVACLKIGYKLRFCLNLHYTTQRFSLHQTLWPVTFPHMPEPQPQLELLAPAGDEQAMRAAVANGANAVYFGLANFNARHRAENAAPVQLAGTLQYLHAHNVRGYVAFNTLIFSEELPQALACLREIAAAGADAVIIQDLGLLHLAGLLAPSLPRHGSTQMTLTDARGIEVVKRLGVSRVILARELSLAEIARITGETQVPVEVFCHGALCVAYSGQCLTSESLGGRSANRGMCAQACRLPYELVVNQARFDTHGWQFLLSPQDLASYDRIPQLLQAGVSALKIEGRLKSAQYVAATTSAYRAAIDAAAVNRHFALSAAQQAQLTQSFSRGFTHGFLDGPDHQHLDQGSFSKKRGIQVGKVLAHTPNGISITLLPGRQVKAGDGVVFDEGHPEQDEQGGRVFDVRPASRGAIELRFMPGAVASSAISPGALVWKTDAPAINRQLQQTYNRDVIAHRQPLYCDIRAVIGEKLIIELRDATGQVVSISSETPLEAARKHPLDEALVREQIGRLGDTPYELTTVKLHGRTPTAPAEAVMVPKSVLNELRRQAITQLLALRCSGQQHRCVNPQALDSLRQRIAQTYPPANQTSPAPARLTVLVRSLEQLQALCNSTPSAEMIPPAMIWCEFEDVRRYPEAITLARAAGLAIGLATMRIHKPGEDGLIKQIGDCQSDAILVRNLSSLAYFSTQYPQIPLVGDYSLNVANELAAWVLLQQVDAPRLVRLTPSYDLNWNQLQGMLAHIGGEVFEMVLHQHMPMFHVEHCVFAHMLSQGRDYHTCGRPCENNHVQLQDRTGQAHPLLADAGCRNTVYNGRPQSIAGYVPQLRQRGICHFRVELLQENAQETLELLRYYSSVLSGQTTARRPAACLKVLNLMGVTPGTMEFE